MRLLYLTRLLTLAVAALAAATSVSAQSHNEHHDDSGPPPGVEESGWPTPRVTGMVQVDAVVLNQASADEVDPGSGLPLNQNRFVLRRARVQADIDRGHVRGLFAIDADSLVEPRLRVFGAEVSLNYPADAAQPLLTAAGGLFVIPFGYGTLESDRRRFALEPSTWVQALFPGRRDLGVRVEGHWRFLHAVVAVMNGEPNLSSLFPMHDPNAAKDIIGRVTANAATGGKTTLESGVSLLVGTGFHRGRPQSKDMFVWRDANEDAVVQSTEIMVIGGAPAEASRNFDRFALGADLALRSELPRLGALNLYAELVWAKNLDRGVYLADPIALGRDLRELGYATGFRQQLTRHAEIGVRYDRYQPDFDASERLGIALVPIDAYFSTWAFTVAWTTLGFGRVVVQYDRHHNPLGRSRNGTPTTLAADVLTVRTQLVF
ncbi:MAG: hypothetical protein ABW321_17090 [Polyangiales bacterium]